MNSPITISNAQQSPTRFLLCALMAIGVFTSTRLSAQTAVTGLTYGSWTSGSSQTVGQVDYMGYNRPVSQIQTSANTYNMNGPLADQVIFRRSGSRNNNTSAFYQYNSYESGISGPDAEVYGRADSSPTAQEIMRSGNLTMGLRNPFANSSSNDIEASNIERMDFLFTGGHVVTGNELLVFFDLENAGNFGDGFRIAAISGLSGSTPTTYANTGKLVAPDSFGSPVSTPTGGNSTYLRVSTSNGDTLTGSQDIAVLDSNSGGSSELYLVGIALTFADLGISVGQTVYGYSLMAGDVNAGSNYNDTTRLANWQNTSVYYNNTDAAGYGNMDFMGFGAQLATKVPEPSTYGMIFMGLGVVFFGFRKWQQARQQQGEPLAIKLRR